MDAADDIRRARPQLGTFVEIAVGGAPAPAIEAAVEAAFAAVAEVHRLMSPDEPASDVSRINRGAGRSAVVVHPWTLRVLAFAAALHRSSGGVFDVTAGSIYPPAGAAVALLPGNRVHLRNPCRIDLGGIAKGFAVDRAIAVLRRHAMPRGLVNAGGDLAAFGAGPHAVHLRDPRDPRQTMLQVAIRDAAVASSGGRFDPAVSSAPESPDTIDPRTGQPAGTVLGATVRAPSCMVADALAKVVMIAGEAASELLRDHGASALFVSRSGELHFWGEWQDAVRLAA
jgi:thiamine biosynthesis lipoprotein